MNELSRKLEEILRQEVEKNEIAGANILAVKNGVEMAYAQAGYADAEKKIPYERDTVTRLYSMTKPITAAAVLLLMERGELDISTPVEEFIPEFKEIKVEENGRLVPAGRSIRIYELLHMTSGLCYGNAGQGQSYTKTQELFEEIIAKMDTEQALTTMEVAKRLAGCPLSFQPAEKFQYGTSADVLGAVIECVSGKRLSTFMEEEFFAPLGMKDTGFYVPAEKQHRLAQAYRCGGGKRTLYLENNLGISNKMDRLPAYEAGGAGLVSTLDDYMKFAEMLMQQGSFEGKQIMKPGTVEYLVSSGLTSWQQESMDRSWVGLEGYSYGNLMRVMKNPTLACMRVTEGEYGWDGWLGDYFVNSPKDKITMLLTCQKVDAGTTPMTRRLKNVVWGSLG